MPGPNDYTSPYGQIGDVQSTANSVLSPIGYSGNAPTSPASPINPATGGIINAGLGLFGTILNLGVNLWAMKKQEKQVAAANAKEDQRYAEQQATSAQNTAFNQGVTKTKEARTAAADRLAGIQGLVGQQQKKFVV